MTDSVNKELKIYVVEDVIMVVFNGEQVAYGNLVQESFTKVGVIEEYKFIIEEERDETI